LVLRSAREDVVLVRCGHREQNGDHMIVVAIANGKGGVGKSSVAAHLAVDRTPIVEPPAMRAGVPVGGARPRRTRLG
jgi:hypothetical protein